MFDPRRGAVAPVSGAARYQSGISRGVRKRKLPFHCARCGKPKALANVFGPQIGVIGQDLIFSPSPREQTQNGRNRDSQPAHAGHTSHLSGIYRNGREILHRHPAIVALCQVPQTMPMLRQRRVGACACPGRDREAERSSAIVQSGILSIEGSSALRFRCRIEVETGQVQAPTPQILTVSSHLGSPQNAEPDYPRQTHKPSDKPGAESSPSSHN